MQIYVSLGQAVHGKSYYTKLLILRNRLLGIEQYIIDPEREYINICNNLEGTLFKIGPTSETFINPFDIREESIEDTSKGYLATKIRKTYWIFKFNFWRNGRRRKGYNRAKIN